MYLAFRQGHVAKAQRLGIPIAQLSYALFRESNPIPVKYALSLLGLMSPKVRLPPTELADQAKAEVASVLSKLCNEYAGYIIGTMCATEVSCAAE